MNSIFLYGTLCHGPLRALVSGEEDGQLVPASLPDHAVYWARGESYPLIVSEPGSAASGLLIVDPSPRAVARMDYYEAGFGYGLQTVTVDTESGPVTAKVYLPPPSGVVVGAPWDLDVWARTWGDLSCLAADEIMTDMDARPAVEVGRRFNSLRARAQARMNARDTAPTTLRRRAVPGDVRVSRRRLAYSKFFSVEEYDFSHKRFAGGYGREVNREAFISADAVTVLPYDPVRDRVMLIEQFRTGPFARGDSQPWMLEAIAGRVDGGETAEAAARREAVEEAGLTLGALHLVGKYYPTPGAKSEFLYGFVAEADLPDSAAGLGGLESEGEDIRSHIIPFDQAMDLIDSGEINVGPLILLVLQLARLRPRLRGAG